MPSVFHLYIYIIFFFLYIYLYSWKRKNRETKGIFALFVSYTLTSTTYNNEASSFVAHIHNVLDLPYNKLTKQFAVGRNYLRAYFRIVLTTSLSPFCVVVAIAVFSIHAFYCIKSFVYLVTPRGKKSVFIQITETDLRSEFK